MHQLLKKYFGYTEFRPLQKEIIESVMAQKDVLVVMPTGGGKSLCYQLPAVMLDGLTVVVSPLISLMKDQVDSLRTYGIAAACWNSSLTPAEIQSVKANLSAGKLKLLYLAPERLMLPNFLNFLSNFPIKLFAIDEAHCISEWGHDFRPEYRQLQVLKTLFNKIPVIALTATATPRVQTDIIEQLKLNQAPTFIASFNRPNLYYEVRSKTDTYSQIVDYLNAHSGDSGIIYCMSRQRVEELTLKLQADGFRALPYHAGMENEDRHRNQEKFIRDDADIIVATIAFGMGIDKPNVRFVIHHDLPKNIEGYYQETGRAGRDGLKSDCILFYSYGDRRKIEYFFQGITDEHELKIAIQKLNEMIRYAESIKCRRVEILQYFGEKFTEPNCKHCDNCLKEKNLFDATIPAQKIFSCIARVKERFGMNYVIDILTGSKNERIIHNGHQNLTTYGIGKEFTKKEWQIVFRYLIQMGYLVVEGLDYPIIRLTQQSKEVLFNDAQVMLPSIKEKIQKVEPAAAIPVNRELFDKLRVLRKSIADEQNVAAYIIFHDSTLEQMASTFPQSWEALKRIPGMGESKLKKFGPKFLKEIIAFCQLHGIQEISISQKIKQHTNFQANRDKGLASELITYQFVQKGLNLTEIARERQLATSTINSHLERLILSGYEIDMNQFMDSQKINRILETLNKHIMNGFKAVKDALGANYSYDEIKLVWAYWKRSRS
ncbi:DNA helicase RecQ [candidate division KSB1 bacterium]|nr:DNA helicase RecQ [candidate division KSB1 bacterium]